MAYSPIEQGHRFAQLLAFSERRGLTPAQVALAWVLSHEGVIAIPKAKKLQHVSENRAAADVLFTAQESAELDKLYPPPAGKTPLEML